MKCPTDGTTLALSERNGIEIDYCPECRGVWLDRGELDKILERASNDLSFTSPGPASGYPAPARDNGHGGGHGGSHGGGGHGNNANGQRRRGGWLGELFD
jgi:Zn-finger nucleic acid-binding protein